MSARSSDVRAQRKPEKRSVLHDILACILPICSLAISLVGATYVFRYVQGMVASAEVVASADQQQPAQETVETVSVYTGVEDPWITSGTFTVGTPELDGYIKEFCDAHTNRGDTPQVAARSTYNAIVQSTYVDQLQKPEGTNWVHRSAQQFFSYKKDGSGAPQGDYYEFAAVTALCLRYFGYSDAIAVPVLHGTDPSTQYGSALCLVTNSDGVASVCDPALGVDGWMIRRAGYNILVDDIGQDLSTAEGLGLQIQRQEPKSPQKTTNGMGNGTGTSYTTGTGNSYGTGTNTSYTTGTGTSYSTGTGTSYSTY